MSTIVVFVAVIAGTVGVMYLLVKGSMLLSRLTEGKGGDHGAPVELGAGDKH